MKRRRLTITLTPREESEWADDHECSALFEAINNFVNAGHEHLSPVLLEVITGADD